MANGIRTVKRRFDPGDGVVRNPTSALHDASAKQIITKQASSDGMLKPEDRVSIIATLALTLLVIALAVIAFFTRNWATYAAALGGLGGLVHELAQSQGKILFFRKYEDGFYLGSVAGMIMGAVAGALAVQGSVVGAARANVDPYLLGYQGFLAGLALKGIAEAAGGQVGASVPKTSLSGLPPVPGAPSTSAPNGLVVQGPESNLRPAAPKDAARSPRTDLKELGERADDVAAVGTRARRVVQ